MATGSGANVLGDPRIALTWLVNELRTYADGIAAGQFVTTGTCVIPVPIQRGDTVRVISGTSGRRKWRLTLDVDQRHESSSGLVRLRRLCVQRELSELCSRVPGRT